MTRNSSLDFMLSLVVIATIILAAHAAGIVLCPFRRFTGFPCPGCGATRAVLHILQGDIPSAFRLNPLVTASTVIVPAGWFFLRKRKITPVLTIILIVGASIAVVLNWIYLFLQHGMRS